MAETCKKDAMNSKSKGQSLLELLIGFSLIGKEG